MEAIKEYGALVWALIATGVGAIFWFARLEARVNQTIEDIDRLEKQIDSDRADARASRAETNDILREVQRDIKLLIGRNHQ
ncbi:hypothetical protein RM190_04990 [Paracoccus sp. CPCC 101403]|uniref:Uncharacterized protein n=1 Tax=Paracoccus broussonetiae TaxID=3075834 RepID=A0ABU3ECK2_9RHOB|nr:hypothetical protein [Paracoccus sp. CPCC 101403]MDT1061205.1 hypothetical protein [Paracoccus sp. CPCC 101403]